MHLYAYVGNDPVNASDPSGMVIRNDVLDPCGANGGRASASCQGSEIINPPDANQSRGGVRAGRAGAGGLTDPAEGIRAAEISQLDAEIQTLSPGSPSGLRNPGSASQAVLTSLRTQVESLRRQPLINNQEASNVARALGFRPTAGLSKSQLIFTNGKIFITREIPRESTGRTDNGGVWKASNSIEGLGRSGKLQGQRMTLDRGLEKIGR